MGITIMETFEKIDLCDNLLANMTISILGYKRDIGVVFKKDDDDSAVTDIVNGKLVITEDVYNKIKHFVQKAMFGALKTVTDIMPHRVVGVAFANGDLTKPVFVFDFKINKNNRGKAYIIKLHKGYNYVSLKNDIESAGDKLTVEFK